MLSCCCGVFPPQFWPNISGIKRFDTEKIFIVVFLRCLSLHFHFSQVWKCFFHCVYSGEIDLFLHLVVYRIVLHFESFQDDL